MANADRERKTPKHLLDRLKAAYAADPETGRARAQNYREQNRGSVNARRRSNAARRRGKELATAWEAYQQNPPDRNLPPGEQLRTWLNAKGWTMRHFARQIGVSSRSVFDWLSGKHPPVGGKRRRLFETTGLGCFVVPPLRQKRPKYDEEVTVAGKLLKELTIHCGLASREIRRLEVAQVEKKGIRLENGRLIIFGRAWHEVDRDVVERWMALAQPQKYLFFRHKPVDRGRPATQLWIARILKKSGVAIRRSQTPRVRHFAIDAKRFGTGKRFLDHLRNVHLLSKTHSTSVWKGLVAKSVALPIQKRLGRPANKRALFLQAKNMHANGESWSKIAKNLVPKEFGKDWRAAKERIRIGVLDLNKRKPPKTK